ncbi:MAG: carboxypeptidase-like regulatory domain-containing protein [Flavobacteriales bacterium]|nr:carboxypeptidase-like regulatory domain-containing protein [Flavobacteriales bacterium]
MSGQEVVQFSGIIVTGDSLTPVPYASIIIESTNRGTTSDFYGYFSFVAQENDTVLFSALGYRKARFIIPDSLSDKRYSLIQVLFTDTVQLGEVYVYPWPSREAFAEAFINASAPSDDLSRARENLTPSRMLVMMETMDRDGFTNYKLSTQEYNDQIYYSGQAPPINLMNPVAWASFIQALRDGSLKR